MRTVAILFAATPSVYDALPGVVVYDRTRDARTFPGGMPVVAHPPCAQWGRLRYFAKDDPQEKALAFFAVEQVRRWGGVLEHPFASSLWRIARLPEPGKRDSLGGFTLPLNQNWFGHRARKPTLLYIAGIQPRDLPAPHFSIAPPTATIETEIRGRPGALPAVTRAERSATPPPFADWLLAVARSTRNPAAMLLKRKAETGMTALEELMADRARSAASRFFLRIGQAGRASEDDNPTLPLFSFMDFMEAEGLLAKDVAR